MNIRWLIKVKSGYKYQGGIHHFRLAGKLLCSGAALPFVGSFCSETMSDAMHDIENVGLMQEHQMMHAHGFQSCRPAPQYCVALSEDTMQEICAAAELTENRLFDFEESTSKLNLVTAYDHQVAALGYESDLPNEHVLVAMSGAGAEAVYGALHRTYNLPALPNDLAQRMMEYADWDWRKPSSAAAA